MKKKEKVKKDGEKSQFLGGGVEENCSLLCTSAAAGGAV